MMRLALTLWAWRKANLTGRSGAALRSLAALLCAVSLFWGITQGHAQTKPDGDKDAKVIELKKDQEQAMEQVRKIVNQKVQAYARPAGMTVSMYQGGWFHEGAQRPNFDTVDIRQSQDLQYAQHPYVASDLKPQVVYKGSDLEFNSMTKFFYTDRTVPKKKLTEAEMLEINRLYRIIGKCDQDIRALTMPPEAVATDAATTNDTETVVMVRQPVPRENYVKAAIGVSLVLAVYVVYRLVKK